MERRGIIRLVTDPGSYVKHAMICGFDINLGFKSCRWFFLSAKYIITFLFFHCHVCPYWIRKLTTANTRYSFGEWLISYPLLSGGDISPSPSHLQAGSRSFWRRGSWQYSCAPCWVCGSSPPTHRPPGLSFGATDGSYLGLCLEQWVWPLIINCEVYSTILVMCWHSMVNLLLQGSNIV